MLTSFTAFLKTKECKLRLIHLAFSTILGAGFGVLFSATADRSYLLMMRSAARTPASIVGLVVVGIVPFLICLLAVSRRKQSLIYPVCFCRIFLYSAGVHAIHLSFGSAGWLMGFLVHFSDCLLIPVLFWYALRAHFGGKKRDIWICLGISALVILLDCCIISPFAAKLLYTYETMGRYAFLCWI